MPKEEKPLPKPPTTPFGRKRRFEEREGDAPLLADRLAAAMAEGRLEEVMKEEVPDSEEARNLVMMMMGMSGMMPPSGFVPAAGERPEEQPGGAGEKEPPQETPSGLQPPEDVLKAIQSGDVEGLRGLLDREHRKRMGESGGARGEVQETEGFPGLSAVEKETLDDLTKIASENNLSMDWLVLRALKLYVVEYQRSGRL